MLIIASDKNNLFAETEVKIQSFNSLLFPFIYANITVRSNGLSVNNLTKDDFQVYENNAIQTNYFEITPPQEGDGVRLADIVFIIDCSGSMGGEIADVRNNVINFANALQSSNIDYRLGLVRFGYGNGSPYLFNGGNLTGDANQFKGFVSSLGASGSYEPGLQAIQQAITGFNFRPGSQKIFIIVTDEDSDAGDLQTTINMLIANSITVHSAASCNSGASQTHYCNSTSVRGMTGGLLFNVSSSYNEILNTIVEQTSSNYLVRYKSNNPTLDGIQRIVEIFATAYFQRDSDLISYMPGSAPNITLTEDTYLLFSKPPVEGSNITISAYITDNILPAVQSAKIYFRTIGDNSYQSAAMTKTIGNIWAYQIPGSASIYPGVEFYMTATDGQSTGSYPKSDPGDKPINIAVLPNELPVINHEKPLTAKVGSAITISANVSDSTYSLYTVSLFFRKKGEILFTEQGVSVGLQSYNFSSQIPSDKVTSDGVEYYIEAVDNLGTKSTFGSPSDPITIYPVGTSDFIPQDPTIEVGLKRVYLNWKYKNLIKDYNIYFKIKFKKLTDSDFIYYPNNTTPEVFNDVWALVENLEKDSNYQFKIVADYNGQEYDSRVVSAKIPSEYNFKIDFDSPVLLIPGTGGEAGGWKEMKSHLEDLGLIFGGEIKDNFTFGLTKKANGDFFTCNYPDPCGPIKNNYQYTKEIVDEIRGLVGYNKKLTLVGQSLGGLRARTYVQQKNDTSEQIDQKVSRLVTIGTPNLGVLKDHANYEKAGSIYGVWRILLGDSEENTQDFWSWSIWCNDDKNKCDKDECNNISCTNYKFECGYINDKNRFKDKQISCDNQDSVRMLLEYLRDGFSFIGGGWNFYKEALKSDVIADSEFMKSINCWISGNCSNSEFGFFPENLEYRYVVGYYPKGGFSSLIPEAKWYNYFMFGDENQGDGFISVESQNLKAYHSSLNAKAIFRPGKHHLSELSDHIGLLQALDFNVIVFRVKCPVDIEIQSPSGKVQSKWNAEILGADYDEADVDGDGMIDKFIEVPFPEEGEYKIFLTPEIGAPVDSTYTLEVDINGETTILKMNAKVAEINNYPEAIFINAPPVANAGIDFTVNANIDGKAKVNLNGSMSYDSGSTPGTHDSIVLFEWFKDGNLIATGEFAQVELGIGAHELSLIVHDKNGAEGSDKIFIKIEEYKNIMGDLDNDGDIDNNDLNIILKYRNQPSSANPYCDLDGDGMITGLDARKLVTLCTRPRCSTN
jgi:pimeloyl-ACP methyl ester carboxylesterase